MKNETPLFRIELQGEAIQTLSKAPELRKALTNISLAAYQQKSKQQHVVTKKHYQSYQVIRSVDNRLLCKENGQMIPSTRRGGIDKRKLVSEILQGKWFPLPR